ncbi:hypothetical protein N7456_008062 [Penicillium angulare]|uniref:Uncharacterized protein n=1 Tax=Penicillium angulare TaxID=116970 RepID=A0A9W9FBS8_9EURO|nr:hypothetical protein N7456_008062 [Penicillium angulare]
MTTKAVNQLNALYNIIDNQQQPEDWTNYDSTFRILSTWSSFFGRPKYVNGVNTGVTWTQTKINMKHAISLYQTVLSVLSSKSLSGIINCNDAFLKKTGTTTADQKHVLYHDTRHQPAYDVWLPSSLSGKLCHETQETNGWTWQNPFAQRDEITICPKIFDNAKNEQLSSVDNSMSGLQNKELGYYKYLTAGGTLMHELTHAAYNIGFDLKAGDQLVTLPGTTSTTPAYGVKLIRLLATTASGPSIALKNADTYAFFALAMYLDACDWSREVCGAQDFSLRKKTPNGAWNYLKFDY